MLEEEKKNNLDLFIISSSPYPGSTKVFKRVSECKHRI